MANEVSQAKVEQLVRALIQSSISKSIQWGVTADDDAFRLTSESANVRIEKSEIFDHGQEESFLRRVLAIFNNKGRLVEEYIPESPIQRKDFDELFNLARRSAYDTDTLLDQLLKEVAK